MSTMRPQQHRTVGTGTSPIVQPQRSPTMVPAAIGSVGRVEKSPGMNPQQQQVVTGQFRPPAPLSLGESAIASVPVSSDKTGRRVDPVKFKTDLCRNWEQTGTCSFKGCTFAHGHDELRPVLRPNGGAPQPVSAQAYVDHLSRMLVTEVSKEVQVQCEHQEANRKLEQDLREVQVSRQALLQKLSAVEKEYEALLAAAAEKDRVLISLRRQASGGIAAPPVDSFSPTQSGVEADVSSNGRSFDHTESGGSSQAAVPAGVPGGDQQHSRRPAVKSSVGPPPAVGGSPTHPRASGYDGDLEAMLSAALGSPQKRR